MTPAAYVNVHGQPVGVSARDAVIEIYPDAVARNDRLLSQRGRSMWLIRRNGHRNAAAIGTGATEEAAWREAWSRILTDAMAKEGL